MKKLLVIVFFCSIGIFAQNNVQDTIGTKKMFDAQTNQPKIQIIRPYENLIWVGILSLAISYDYLTTASDADNTISTLQKLRINTSELESRQTQKTAIGAIAAIVGIYLIAISFDEVEIKATANNITLSYSF